MNELIINEIRFNTEDIGAIIYMLAATLNFMHFKGFIHRDIKPENITF